MTSPPQVGLVAATEPLLTALNDDRAWFGELIGSPVPDGWPEFPEAIDHGLRDLRLAVAQRFALVTSRSDYDPIANDDRANWRFVRRGGGFGLPQRQFHVVFISHATPSNQPSFVCTLNASVGSYPRRGG